MYTKFTHFLRFFIKIRSVLASLNIARTEFYMRRNLTEKEFELMEEQRQSKKFKVI